MAKQSRIAAGREFRIRFDWAVVDDACSVMHI